MYDVVKNKLKSNAKIYSNTLERIVQKYSKLHDNGTEVNLEDITPEEVRVCMVKSELELSKLGLSKSDVDLAELSLGDVSEIHRPQNIIRDFKMDISYHQDDPKDDCVDEGAGPVNSNDSVMQQATENSHLVDNSKLNGTRISLWGAPEELERSLSSQRSTLLDQYPSMVSQVGEAWRRQHMSDVAVGVLRRYHRLRWFSNRNLNNRTFNIRPAHRKTTLNNGQSFLQTPQNTILNTKVNLQEWPAERLSHRKGTDSGNGQPSHPVLVMDFSSRLSSAGSSPASSPPSAAPSLLSAPSFVDSSPPSSAASLPSSLSSPDSSLQESPEPEEPPLNQTFMVSMPSSPSPRVRHTTLDFSPARSEDTFTAGGLSSPSLRKCALPTFPHQRFFTAVCPVVCMEMSSDYRSPVAQSHSRARLLIWDGQRAASNAHHRSPKSGFAGYHQRNTVEPRSSPESSPSSLHRPLMPPRKPHHLDSCNPSQLKLQSSRLSSDHESGAGQPRLRRNYSLDSFSPSVSLLRNSAKQIDKDFQKLYHRLVCQDKSSSSSCRTCERRAETTRGTSSSALAALALSPHHSVMRKRRRELVQEQSPESKRYRDSSFAYSPGSHRQRVEMFRCQNRSDSHLSSNQWDISCDSHNWSPRRASLAHTHHSPHHQHHSSNVAVRKAEGSWPGLHVDQHSPAWREKYSRFVGLRQGKSIVNAECQCGCSPSFSRRQLLYK
uniref:serine/arginine repetitive matrix protein 2-like isoform X2 n=1 Tax=Oncorhynchus gorbuscha TaxID=8017 RepID=UPI001EAEB683|nr:serine/arginine repetitive matrix protein 2-like isoform X2 [Oncorhynchus gorbuscha]